MDFLNYKSVAREVSEKYLNYLFFERLSFDAEKVDSLFEDIVYTCENLKLPKIKKNDLMLVKEWNCGRVSYKHISYLYHEIRSEEDFVLYFTKQILENEAKSFTNFELFKMQSDIDRLDKVVSALETRNALFH